MIIAIAGGIYSSIQQRHAEEVRITRITELKENPASLPKDWASMEMLKSDLRIDFQTFRAITIAWLGVMEEDYLNMYKELKYNSTQEGKDRLKQIAEEYRKGAATLPTAVLDENKLLQQLDSEMP